MHDGLRIGTADDARGIAASRARLRRRAPGQARDHLGVHVQLRELGTHMPAAISAGVSSPSKR